MKKVVLFFREKNKLPSKNKIVSKLRMMNFRRNRWYIKKKL